MKLYFFIIASIKFEDISNQNRSVAHQNEFYLVVHL